MCFLDSLSRNGQNEPLIMSPSTDRPALPALLRTRLAYEWARVRMRLERSCPFCKSTRFGVDYEYSPVLVIRRCNGCGLAYTHPRPRASRLRRYYSQKYRVAGITLDEVASSYSADRLAGSPFDRSRELGFIQAGMRDADSKGTRLLDIGCSWGFLLVQAREFGFDVRGVEISAPNAQRARAEFGLDVFNGQLEDARFANESFDVVAAIHSFEHLPDPRKSLREVRRIIREGGLFLIIVPNYDSYLRKHLHEEWEWLTPRDHYFHFSRCVLEAELNAAGFRATFSSDEGHYGLEALAARVSAEEIPRRLAALEGSELVATAIAGR